jgi:ERCC4-type nuclease
MINVDHRERKILEHCTEQKVIVNRVCLKLGDFEIIGSNGRKLLVERKSYQDLIASIMDGRYRSQIDRLEKEESALIILTGNLESALRESGVSRNSVLGCITSIMIKHKVSILHLDRDEYIPYVLKSLEAKMSV